MSLLDEVVMHDCAQVYHYLLNKIRYISKNQSDVNERLQILADTSDYDTRSQSMICALSNPRIQELYLKLTSYLN